MEWVNYHHLLYFWSVAREGSLARAAGELRLAQSTVSKQIHLLEETLGHELFQKSGRRLVLTESGKVVYRYADEIFRLGREMVDTLHDRPVGKPLRVTVGIADVVPKLMAEKVLSAAFHMGSPVRLICREGRADRLIADLALHDLDMILTDAPAVPNVKIRAFSHLLGDSEVALFAPTDLAPRLREEFPASLDGAPMLLPTENTALRMTLDQWFETRGVRPDVVGEFEDSALLREFGQKGAGIFPAPYVMAGEIEAHYKVMLIGRVPEVRERLYAVTVERKIKNPAVIAICETAKLEIFGGGR